MNGNAKLSVIGQDGHAHLLSVKYVLAHCTPATAGDDRGRENATVRRS